MRKIIILTITVSLLLSVGCFAYTDVTDPALTEKLETLSAMNIISGYEDGTFRPESNITRAEFAKIITSSIVVDSAVTEINTFTDTSEHWASDFIILAKYFGIINGTTETTFEPESNVTYNQAIKMIVAALGYNEEANALGGYPQGYVSVAENLNLLDGISSEPSEQYATRADIAVMTENALHCPFYFLTNENGTVTREISDLTLTDIYELSTSDVDPNYYFEYTDESYEETGDTEITESVG